MSANASAEAIHPRPTELALYASGDLPWKGRIQMRWHVRTCQTCAAELEDLRHAIADLRSGRVKEVTWAAPVMDWPALELEMLGNVAVGLAAARCIDKVRTHSGLVWRASLLAAVLAVLFVLGWLTHIPREQDEHLFGVLQRLFRGNGSVRGAAVVRAETQELSLGSGSGATGVTLLHPPAADTSSVGSSEIDVRYLDDETGQVTILRVSAVQNYGPQ